MALNIKSVLTSLKELVRENNTITSSYDISGSLNRRVTNVYQGVSSMHQHAPIPIRQYPVVFVEIGEDDETLTRLGANAKRDVEIRVDVVPVTNYGAGSGDELTALENAHMENVQLCGNLKTLFRNKITLTGTVAFVDVVRTEYATMDNDDQAYNIVSRIQLNLNIKNTT